MYTTRYIDTGVCACPPSPSGSVKSQRSGVFSVASFASNIFGGKKSKEYCEPDSNDDEDDDSHSVCTISVSEFSDPNFQGVKCKQLDFITVDVRSADKNGMFRLPHGIGVGANKLDDKETDDTSSISDQEENSDHYHEECSLSPKVSVKLTPKTVKEVITYSERSRVPSRSPSSNGQVSHRRGRRSRSPVTRRRRSQDSRGSDRKPVISRSHSSDAPRVRRRPSSNSLELQNALQPSRGVQRSHSSDARARRPSSSSLDIHNARQPSRGVQRSRSTELPSIRRNSARSSDESFLARHDKEVSFDERKGSQKTSPPQSRRVRRSRSMELQSSRKTTGDTLLSAYDIMLALRDQQDLVSDEEGQEYGDTEHRDLSSMVSRNYFEGFPQQEGQQSLKGFLERSFSSISVKSWNQSFVGSSVGTNDQLSVSESEIKPKKTFELGKWNPFPSSSSVSSPTNAEILPLDPLRDTLQKMREERERARAFSVSSQESKFESGVNNQEVTQRRRRLSLDVSQDLRKTGVSNEHEGAPRITDGTHDQKVLRSTPRRIRSFDQLQAMASSRRPEAKTDPGDYASYSYHRRTTSSEIRPMARNFESGATSPEKSMRRTRSLSRERRCGRSKNQDRACTQNGELNCRISSAPRRRQSERSLSRSRRSQGSTRSRSDQNRKDTVKITTPRPSVSSVIRESGITEEMIEKLNEAGFNITYKEYMRTK